MNTSSNVDGKQQINLPKDILEHIISVSEIFFTPTVPRVDFTSFVRNIFYW